MIIAHQCEICGWPDAVGWIAMMALWGFLAWLLVRD